MWRDWRWLPLEILCAAGVASGVEFISTRAMLSLGQILFFRGLIGFAVVVAWCAAKDELVVRSPGETALRTLTGGLTFLGWFGAIPFLSAPVASALLLLDAIVVSILERRNGYTRIRALAFLSLAIFALAYVRWREHPLALSMAGVPFIALAIGSRAAGFLLWARAHARGELLAGRVAAPLLGSALAGLAVLRGDVELPSLGPLVLLALNAALGVASYLLTDAIVGRVGARRARVATMLSVPAIWLANAAIGLGETSLMSGVAVLGIALAVMTAAEWRRTGAAAREVKSV